MLLVLIAMVAGMEEVKGQTYASTARVLSGTVAGISNAALPDNSYATMTVDGGLFPTKTSIQLLFSSSDIVPANTPVYVKVNASTNITITGYSGGTSSSLGSPITLVTSSTVYNSRDNNYFIAVSSSSSFNSLKIEFAGTLLGPTTANLFHAFYNIPNPADCGVGFATSVTTSGVPLLGGGVTDPYKAIDTDPNSFAHMNLGAIGLLATVNENVHFSTLSNAGDAVRATFSIPPSFLASVGLLSNISVQAYNGNTTVGTRQSLNNLLTLDLLGLLGSNAKYTFYFVPSGSFDRIEFTIGGVLTIATELDLYDVQRVQSPLTVEASPLGLINVCGTSTTVNIKNPQLTTTYNWYSTASGGSPIFTGSSYVVNGLTPGSTTTYYIDAVKSGCNNSLRYPVQIKSTIPVVSEISGASSVCVGSKTTFSSTSAIAGSWSSNATGIASVNATTGEVTGVAAGTATISYVVTDVANSCGKTVTKSIEVNAPLVFTSSLSTAVCTHLPFSYTATSNGDTRTTYTWTRAAVAGISNSASSGTTALVSETLYNTTTGPVNTIYIFKLNIGGCNEITVNVTVTVKPFMPAPHLNITSN
uniref:immunoglobulin domain-containing protein n=1 Tax=Pedobacter schmidteae TaxID=2201271 RepID=UPI0013CE50F1|nr:Ig-like domain-containing protein [Pedobacter schmidteae]